VLLLGRDVGEMARIDPNVGSRRLDNDNLLQGFARDIPAYEFGITFTEDNAREGIERMQAKSGSQGDERKQHHDEMPTRTGLNFVETFPVLSA
jgi:hypothetical protein